MNIRTFGARVLFAAVLCCFAFATAGCDIGGGSSGSSNNTSAQSAYLGGSGDSDQNGNGDQGGETITDAQEPIINAVNLDDATYTQEATANDLAVDASVEDDGDLTYQWYKSDSEDTTNAQAIDGETNKEYKPLTENTGTLYYFVEVTNTNDNATGARTATATSDTARIVVNTLTNAQPPSIQTNPRNATYTLGDLANDLIVEASVESGGTLSYQWYKNTRNNTTDATAITGATGAAYKPSTADIGTLYYFVKVTNTNNSVGGEQTATVTSKRAQVIVNAPSSANTHIVNVTTRI